MYDAGLFGGSAGLVIVAISGCSGLPLLAVAGAGMLIAGCALTWISVCWMLPASVEFGELRTFRDFAEALSDAIAEPSAPEEG